MKTDKKIVLEKGKSIRFLDYQIKNSENSDGLVLFKDGADGYETHLGNYGEGTKENIDFCKKDALVYYMIARPELFANTLTRKLRKPNSGTYREFYLLSHSLNDDGINVPKEVTAGDGINAMIYFNGKPLTQDMEIHVVDIS